MSVFCHVCPGIISQIVFLLFSKHLGCIFEIQSPCSHEEKTKLKTSFLWRELKNSYRFMSIDSVLIPHIQALHPWAGFQTDLFASCVCWFEPPVRITERDLGGRPTNQLTRFFSINKLITSKTQLSTDHLPQISKYHNIAEVLHIFFSDRCLMSGSAMD